MPLSQCYCKDQFNPKLSISRAIFCLINLFLQPPVIILATPTKYIGGWRGWTVDFAAQNLRNAFGEHPVVETSILALVGVA